MLNEVQDVRALAFGDYLDGSVVHIFNITNQTVFLSLTAGKISEVYTLYPAAENQAYRRFFRRG